ncbi:MAG: NmrA family NAD(P)-binding protein [Sphingobacterium sp.]
MKITVIGSLGNIGSHLTKKLVASGHEVTGVDYKKERIELIKKLGAIPAVGSLDDLDFLKQSFGGADAVFIMYPPVNYFDPGLDLLASYRKRAEKYSTAILDADVKRVVNLSSMGAHLEKGNGPIKGAFYLEEILNKLPAEIYVSHLRPNLLYTNLFGYINAIKSDGKIYAAFGTKSMPWTSPIDVAEAGVEEITGLQSGKTIRYVASEELTGDEVAKIIGKAIQMPELKWEMISNQQQIDKFSAAGMDAEVAESVGEMYAALGSGLMIEDYIKNKPQKIGRVKLKEFAKEFAKMI